MVRSDRKPAAPKIEFRAHVQRDSTRPVVARKIFRLAVGQIKSILPRIPPHEEGRIAIVTDVEAGSGGRETSQHAGMIPRDKRGNALARRSCSIKKHADERCFADGQALWS
jgi:hypothetical protein